MSSNKATYEIGQLVDVEARTWAGINRPGGTGRISSVHYLNGFLDSVDVDYVINQGKDKNVSVEYVRPHHDLGREKRSRRGRDFFSASPAKPRDITKQGKKGGRINDENAVPKNRRNKRRKTSDVPASETRDDRYTGSIGRDSPPPFKEVGGRNWSCIEASPLHDAEDEGTSGHSWIHRDPVQERYSPYRVDEVLVESQTESVEIRHDLIAKASGGARASKPNSRAAAQPSVKRALYGGQKPKPPRGHIPSPSADKKVSASQDPLVTGSSKAAGRNAALDVAKRLPFGRAVNSSSKMGFSPPLARRHLPLSMHRKGASTAKENKERMPEEDSKTLVKGKEDMGKKDRQDCKQPAMKLPPRATDKERAARGSKHGSDEKKQITPQTLMEGLYNERVKSADKFVKQVLHSQSKPIIEPSRKSLFSRIMSDLFDQNDDTLTRSQVFVLSNEAVKKQKAVALFTNDEIDCCLEEMVNDLVVYSDIAEGTLYRV